MVNKKSKKEEKRLLTKKLVSRRVLKPNQMTMVIQKAEPHSILGEENKFFTGILEQEKRSMFFS